MAEPVLQRIAEDVEIDAPSWLDFDLERFSPKKWLWEYQQSALRNASRSLYLYYERFRDFDTGEAARIEARDFHSGSKPINPNDVRRSELLQLYSERGLTANLDYTLRQRDADLLSEYFEVRDKKLAFKHLINRMSFWMATGSGKTLVIVKLIQMLAILIERKEIPAHDILFLAHRDELISQFADHIREFNEGNFGIYIRLHDLKDYANVKRSNAGLFSGDELNVFTYRSDLFSFEQKEKQIDFRNYENGGNWYVLLDEAHKGDKQDSKRQHIYSILARNGFLFNFSATFTDPRDIYTTVYNFNLSEFVTHGYGKHISILKSQVDAFKAGAEDNTGEEKQQIVLQSLIVATLVAKRLPEVRRINPDLYHKPLLITLVNSVNTDDADLKLFFRELERLASGDINDLNFRAAKDDLWASIKDGFELQYETETPGIEYAEFNALTLDEVREATFNTSAKGAIEVIRRPSDRGQIAFKLQNAERPFALIRIGDVSDWISKHLDGYEINDAFSDEGFFETLNEKNSDIRILMGSRTFYEGWDSNRPNVITFINIGTQTDAKKFVLQSIGRGVRIEPLPDLKRRIASLNAAGLLPDPTIASRVAEPATLLETLFIFGTNRAAIDTVVRELKSEKTTYSETIALERNSDVTLNPLLVPKYKLAAEPVFKDLQRRKQQIRPREFAMLRDYLSYVQNDAILLLRHRGALESVAEIREAIRKDQWHFEKTDDAVAYGSLDLLWDRVTGYFRITPSNFENLAELTDEIEHYKKIFVEMTDVSHVERLKEKIKQVAEFKDLSARKAELRQLRDKKEITEDEYEERLIQLGRTTSEEAEFDYMGDRLTIQRLAKHYYIPTIVSQSDKVKFINHIIKVPSEREFLKKMAHYLAAPDNRMSEFDDWAFSKIDESVDGIFIPYIDAVRSRAASFFPDFVYWFKKGTDHKIVFVDPKGMANQYGYSHKIKGYKSLFQDDQGVPRKIKYGEFTVSVLLFLYNRDARLFTDDFWVDDFGPIIDSVLS